MDDRAQAQLEAPPQHRGLTRWLPAVVLALGAIVGVLLAVLLLTPPDDEVGQAGPSPSPSTASAEASTSVAPSPSSEPTATPIATATPVPAGPAQLAWADGPSREGDVNAVTRFGDRWLAGGSTIIGDKWWAAVWASNDGLTWSEPIPVGPEPEGGIEFDGWRHRITAFATWDGGIVAFGIRGFSGSDTLAPMMWRSDDGEHWEFVDSTGTAYGDEWHVPLRAVSSSQGLLVVHSATDLGFGAKAYVTHDLATWETSAIADEELTLTSVSTSTGGSPGLIMVVGWMSEPREADDPLAVTSHVWTSIDGKAWTEPAPPDATAWLTDIAWDEVRGQFVVVGTDADGLPMAWLTTDGSSWAPITLGDAPMSRMQVSAAGGVIAATGVAGPLDGPQTGPTIVWSSHDGKRWWYGTVLNRPSFSVIAAASRSVLLIDNRTGVASGRWVPLVGTLADSE